MNSGDLHSAVPSPSLPGAGWRSSASPGSGPGRSPAAASSSAAHGPPPRPRQSTRDAHTCGYMGLG